jgi:AcrR family transcriptional regulator
MNMAAPRWQRRPQSRRDELLDAATRLLQDQPLDAIKVSDITDAAGTAKGTFYTYFATKADLYEALNRRYLDGLVEAMDQARANQTNGGWFERQDAAFAAVIAYMYERDDLIEVWAREGNGDACGDVFASGLERIAEGFALEIEEAVASGQARCDDPLATALLIAHAVDGLVGADMMMAGSRRTLGAKRVTAAAQAMVRKLLT